MRPQFGIGNDLIKIIKSLLNSAKGYVLLNIQIGTYFNTIVGVRQYCLHLQFYLTYF